MELTIQTNKREEIVDVTSDVREAVKKHGKGNACLVYVPHATCAIIVNENYDKAVCRDIINYLKKQIPEGVWEHDKIDNNADSHIKSTLLGPGQVIPIENRELLLGRWQGIALAELDGPRKRKIVVKIL
jgi:secondary thiamine-phosphate synthase enzyme